MSIHNLICEAVALAGGNLCASGHAWVTEGGRPCPYDFAHGCTQTVFKCSRCGDYDYGDIGGPGYIECKSRCAYGMKIQEDAPN